ncbi:hypothetical protein C7476_102455 [Phyllobacterium bourgognense]|uniref:Uncharacterized protein n=1 Tax=Phyllobacterium bourgognense TaxID=314236 RepID=A0A368Z7Q3_9HYPH|nr:hypothetical protein C7476_102455 [Phyllobacterium bourgognense]
MGGSSQHFVRRMPTAPGHLMDASKQHMPKTRHEPERLSDVLKRSKGAYSIKKHTAFRKVKVVKIPELYPDRKDTSQGR